MNILYDMINARVKSDLNISSCSISTYIQTWFDVADEIRGELLSEGLHESASAVTEIIKEQSKFIKYKGVN